MILGIETSCDETAAALVDEGGAILSDILSSQVDLHKKYGGVVPELASRRHVEVIAPLVREGIERAGVTFSQLRGIAVTVGPGLIGALLVGVSFSKSLAYALKIPLLPVHHLEGHIAAASIEHKQIIYPAVALVVSGGHTNLYLIPKQGVYSLLGKTIDDAAGEALDKGARMLGYGYPGGPVIDRLAQTGDPGKAPFSVPYRFSNNYDFSFSGVKTALMRRLMQEKSDASCHPDIAAGYQRAIVESLVEKTSLAVKQTRAKSIILVGGVAANSLLRRRIHEEGESLSVETYIPSLRYCTDNGAMIAIAGYHRYQRGESAPLTLSPVPNMELEGVIFGQL